MALPIATPLPRVLKPRRATPADAVRPTRAEINLGHLRHNLRVVRRFAGATRVWGVLKADGYGHGASAAARTLERAGIDGICVALLEEGIELREAGIRTPILIMGGYYGQGWRELLAHNLTPVVYELEHINDLAREASFRGVGPVPVHLKVDTGMARLGARFENLDPLFQAIRANPALRLDGMMTHFANADADDLGATEEQCDQFERAVALARNAGLDPTVLHAANSAALMRSPRARYDMARPGIALFGVAPRADITPDLRPVMRVRSGIVSLRTVQTGDPAGYCSTWKAARTSQIATIPIGYADGVPRALSNRGRVLVRGKSAPIVGNVSMDLITVDVTDIPGASVRDEVVILGSQQGPLGTDAITADEIATIASTISWEILTGISRRVPRFFREP